MIDKNENLLADVLKVIIPALVAVGVSIAIQMKVKKITFMNGLMSVIIGVGCAYLFAPLLDIYFKPEWHSVVIGLIAIVGEKIGHWLIFKFNFDTIGKTIENGIVKWLKSFFNL